MSTETKTPAPRIGMLDVQPLSLLVGKNGGFSTRDDFYRYTADCGFTGITTPFGAFFDGNRCLTESGRDEFQGKLQKLGLRDGIMRFEMHVVGQLVCVDPSRLKRFRQFLPEEMQKANVPEVEAWAQKKMFEIIDACALFGIHVLPGFCGGRGYANMQAKWSAWPKGGHNVPLALLAAKWQPILEYAASRGVVITFELGHPENDLLTGANFVTFFGMLSFEARQGVGINADPSHFMNVGVNPMPHFVQAQAQTKCTITTHFKGGAVMNRGYDTSPYGGWVPWSKASTTFVTVGTVGDERLWRQYMAFVQERHNSQPFGCDIITEGECVLIRNPKQAMQVGYHNCIALRDDLPLIRIQHSGAFGWDNMMEEQVLPVQTPIIVGPDGVIIEQMVWTEGDFDAFADTPLPMAEMLNMTPEDVEATIDVLETYGDKDGVKSVLRLS